MLLFYPVFEKSSREDGENLERFKNCGDDYIKKYNQDTEEFVKNINTEYLEKCERVRNGEKKLTEWIDKYISQVIWEFLNKK